MDKFIQVNNNLINPSLVHLVEKRCEAGDWLVRFYFTGGGTYDVNMNIPDAGLDSETYSELADCMISWFHENVDEIINCSEADGQPPILDVSKDDSWEEHKLSLVRDNDPQQEDDS